VRIIGTCSLCGGAVAQDQEIQQLRCTNCRAVPANTYGPLIPMRPKPVVRPNVKAPYSPADDNARLLRAMEAAAKELAAKGMAKGVRR
jgi:hypothetical protein